MCSPQEKHWAHTDHLLYRISAKSSVADVTVLLRSLRDPASVELRLTGPSSTSIGRSSDTRGLMTILRGAGRSVSEPETGDLGMWVSMKLDARVRARVVLGSRSLCCRRPLSVLIESGEGRENVTPFA